jgi:hypothetical protein
VSLQKSRLIIELFLCFRRLKHSFSSCVVLQFLTFELKGKGKWKICLCKQLYWLGIEEEKNRRNERDVFQSESYQHRLYETRRVLVDVQFHYLPNKSLSHSPAPCLVCMWGHWKQLILQRWQLRIWPVEMKQREREKLGPRTSSRVTLSYFRVESEENCWN